MYIQRDMAHFPAAGEIALFDRSWYKRAGVEHVLGFCTEEQYRAFLALTPLVEQTIVDNGIILLKYWFEVSQELQTERFQERIVDGRKIWKLSGMDLESHYRWYDFSRARDAMFGRRDGHVDQLPAEQIVPGGIVLLEAGDRLPADGRLIKDATLEIDESALTGESVPLPKQVEAVAGADTPLGDRIDMAYMNTNVTRGTAELIVTPPACRPKSVTSRECSRRRSSKRPR